MITIAAPGIYDMSAEEYHQDPCVEPSLSSSIARLMLRQTPLHAAARHPKLAKAPIVENKQIFDLGSAAHALLLHDERKFSVCDEDDWRTKAAREQREAAYAAGEIPILAHQLETTRAMVESCRAQLVDHECETAFLPAYGEAEKTFVWQERGVWCRARLDWIPYDIRNGMVFYDYKTTATVAAPERYQRLAFDLGLDVQAAWYMRALRKIAGISSRLRFVVQENKPPFAIVVVELTPEALALAERQVDRAIDIWGRCLKTNDWPGYPSRVCYVDAPPWHEDRVMERESRDPIDNPDNVSIAERVAFYWPRSA